MANAARSARHVLEMCIRAVGDVTNAVHKLGTGDAVGMRDMGIHLVRIAPGDASTEYHTHYCDEEFVYVLSGEVVLVTNDGELANLLAHPRYGVEKKYLVQVAGVPTPETLDKLRRGRRDQEIRRAEREYDDILSTFRISEAATADSLRSASRRGTRITYWLKM